MESAKINGKWEDFHYRKYEKSRDKDSVDFITNFFIGDVCYGQLFKMIRRKETVWTGLSIKVISPLGALGGFRTRRDAVEYILKVNGLA